MLDASQIKALAEFLEGLTELTARTGVQLYTQGRNRTELQIADSWFALQGGTDAEGAIRYAIDTETDDQ